MSPASFLGLKISELLAAVDLLKENGLLDQVILFLCSYFERKVAISLFFIDKGSWGTALALFLVASVGFNCANIFYFLLIQPYSKKERKNTFGLTITSWNLWEDVVAFTSRKILTLGTSYW